MPRISYNVSIIEWGLRADGVAEVTLIRSIPRLSNPTEDSRISERYMIPGGGVDQGETVEQGGRRELRVETGRIIKCKRMRELYLIHKEYKKDDVNRLNEHHKLAFLIERRHCRGKLRTESDPVVYERDSVLLAPVRVPLDEAIDMVYVRRWNTFHPDALRKARDHIRSLGFPTGLVAAA